MSYQEENSDSGQQDFHNIGDCKFQIGDTGYGVVASLKNNDFGFIAIMGNPFERIFFHKKHLVNPGPLPPPNSWVTFRFDQEIIGATVQFRAARVRVTHRPNGSLNLAVPAGYILGRVVDYRSDRQFGFLEPRFEGKQVFFHLKESRSPDMGSQKIPEKNDAVFYRIVRSQDGRGWRAAPKEMILVPWLNNENIPT